MKNFVKKPVLYSMLSFGILLVPVLALAQANPTYIDGWIQTLQIWLGTAIKLIMVVMVLFFLFQVFKYVAEKDPGKLGERKKSVFNALIGLFLAVSVWGIIAIAGNIFGTTANNGNVPGIVCPPGTISTPSANGYICL